VGVLNAFDKMKVKGLMGGKGRSREKKGRLDWMRSRHEKKGVGLLRNLVRSSKVTKKGGRGNASSRELVNTFWNSITQTYVQIACRRTPGVHRTGH